MHQTLRLCCLVPPGFAVVSTVCEESRTVITVRSIAKVRVCPSFGAFTADTGAGLLICRWRDKASSSWWWHAVFAAMASLPPGDIH